MDITDGQFRKFSRLVYDQCGINLHEGKKQLLHARLAKRLRRTGISSTKEYLKVLESDSRELINFLDAISTNQTFFLGKIIILNVCRKCTRQYGAPRVQAAKSPFQLPLTAWRKGSDPESSQPTYQPVFCVLARPGFTLLIEQGM